MNKAEKMLSAQVDELLDRYVADRQKHHRHWTKLDAVRYVMKRRKPPTDPEFGRVVWWSFVWGRAGRIAKRKKDGRREFRSYQVAGEGWRYREARLMTFQEFRLATREHGELTKANIVQQEFMDEVVAEGEQMRLDVDNLAITPAYDAVVERRGDDPLQLREAA